MLLYLIFLRSETFNQMNNKTIVLISCLTISFCFLTCQSGKNTKSSPMENSARVPSPPTIVYKTRGDYFKLVPVILSEDRSRIVSFPHFSDLMIDGKFTYPSPLEEGYLLDNRGINTRAAFLKFSYEDYYNMDNIPDAERLMNYILDDNPFLEFYNLGPRGRFTDPVNQINEMIRNGELKNFRNLANDN